ncbi:glycosyltransferase [Ktedonosporobacter rubrisoli]|uniref:Glycosyltransferase n=1 Tax=Ktedonosporobacter rubrisoli TaxID=2509675 RepID=A0A4P6JVE3_KTERU|nr:glycosyltransferase [Ktedonosporobacter rubrisoli]QBD79300.1 glycosyltransferase [Ktedonosporobacter rubrisoli]
MNRRVRTILLTSDSYPPAVNGIVTHLLLLRKELERRGYRVLTIAPRRREGPASEENVLYIPSFPLPLRGDNFVTLPFPELEKHPLLRSPIDIVHNHLFLIGMLGLRVAQKRNIPAVVTYHTFFRQYSDWTIPWIPKTVRYPLINALARSYFQQHRLIIAPSHKAIDELQQARVKAPIKLITNGIDLARFRLADPQLFRQRYGLAPGKPLVTLTGILERGKNVDLAIRSLARLRNMLAEVQLIIIGDGNAREALEELVARLRLRKQVMITGYLDRAMIASAAAATDVVLFTSDTDTLPTVVIEGMAAGKPVVAVRDDAVLDLVYHRYNGLLVAKDPLQLAEALAYILTQREQARRYGENSRKLAEAFSIERYVDQLEQLYSSLREQMGAALVGALPFSRGGASQ